MNAPQRNENEAKISTAIDSKEIIWVCKDSKRCWSYIASGITRLWEMLSIPDDKQQ